MPLAEADKDAATAPPTPREALRQRIPQHYEELCRSALPMVCKRRRHLPPKQQIDLAEQVVQEALERAWEKADTYDPARGAVPWLMRFILNVLRESVAGRGDDARVATETDIGELTWMVALERDSADADGADAGAAERRRRLVDRAKQTLTDAQRQVVTLRFEQQLDGAALAEAIGAPSAGAARVRLSRALDALRAAVRALENVADEELNP